MSNEAIIRALFGMGGVIVGGMAVGFLYGRPSPDSDIDFFFTDRAAYEAACRFRSEFIDVGFYPGLPYGGVDLSICECYLDGEGVVHMSDGCRSSYESGVMRVNRGNLYNPFGTFRRLFKYKGRFGLSFLDEDLEFVKGLLGYE
jgi:hypothetical protein